MPPMARSLSSSHTSWGGGIRLVGLFTVAKCHIASNASGKATASRTGLRRGHHAVAGFSRSVVLVSSRSVVNVVTSYDLIVAPDRHRRCTSPLVGEVGSRSDPGKGLPPQNRFCDSG